MVEEVTLPVEPELTDAQRNLRDRFVTEYLEDFDVFQAALRVGYTRDDAKTWGVNLFQCPYTQRRIEEEKKAQGLEDVKARDKRRIISMLYRQASDYGPGSSHGARVAALSKLSNIFGLDAPVKTESELTVKSAVQFYIPSNGRDLPDEAAAPAIEGDK